MMLNTTILERHVDLGPLRGRRRGVTHCLFHGADRRPSLSVDLDRGLFHCFACGEQGGVKRFAELVGEMAPERPRRARIVSDYEAALREGLRRERAAAARRAEWLPFALANGYVRDCWKAVRQAHDWAQVLGPDHARTWVILERAAKVETEAAAIEAELDAILEEGRIA